VNGQPEQRPQPRSSERYPLPEVYSRLLRRYRVGAAQQEVHEFVIQPSANILFPHRAGESRLTMRLRYSKNSSKRPAGSRPGVALNLPQAAWQVGGQPFPIPGATGNQAGLNKEVTAVGPHAFRDFAALTRDLDAVDARSPCVFVSSRPWPPFQFLLPTTKSRKANRRTREKNLL
jgi:hypothetical protein